MNRSLIAAVVIGLVLVVCAVANAHNNDASVLNREKRGGKGRKGSGCWWWSRCCVKYDKDVKQCCRHQRRYCCVKSALHDKPKCTNTTEYFPDPCDCTKFFQCFNGDRNHFSCPLRGAWDQSDLECKKVEKKRPPFCGKRPFRLTYLPTIYANYTISVVNGTDNATLLMFTDSAPRDSVYVIMAYFAGTRTDFTFTSTYNKRFWYSIDCINGVCSSVADSTFWSFSINGVQSDVGVSSKIAENGDVIGFTLTSY